MSVTAPSEHRVYHVDAHDCINYVNDEWLKFAQANDGDSLAEGNVLGRELWSYIQGSQLRQIYREILMHVRTHQKPITLRSRCDAPDRLRRISLRIEPLPESALRFACETLEEVPRRPLRILDRHIERSDDLLVICSVCKGIQSHHGHWEELEPALTSLGLLEREALPSLSHGLCPECATEQLRELELSLGSAP